MAELGMACGSGLVTTDGGGASAVGAAAGAALSRSDALSPVADATVAASLVGDGSKTQRIGVVSTAGRSGHAQTGRCHGLGVSLPSQRLHKMAAAAEPAPTYRYARPRRYVNSVWRSPRARHGATDILGIVLRQWRRRAPLSAHLNKALYAMSVPLSRHQL